MRERILGIDLGISSLGWAVIEVDDEQPETNRIVMSGVRIFTAAETPKEKESPNKQRREKRGLRRVIKRKRVRMNALRQLLIRFNLAEPQAFDESGGLFHGGRREDVWKLRSEALNRTLEPHELARVLIHIAKHRGYDFLVEDGESGKVKSAGEALKKAFTESGSRTIGEHLWKTRDPQGKKRNKEGDYTISIHRDLLKEEVATIFMQQRELGSPLATSDLLQQYEKIAFAIKPPLSIENLVGTCTFFPKEKRAPKHSLSAERFVALTKIHNTVVKHPDGSEQKIADLKPIPELLEFAISSEETSYRQLRKLLGIPDEATFKGLKYGVKKKKEELVEDTAGTEKKRWLALKGHAAFQKVAPSLLTNIQTADEAARILTYHKSPIRKKEELERLGIDSEQIEALSSLSFTDFNRLSLKAISVLLPLMEQGQRYDEAMRVLGTPAAQKTLFLPPLKETDIAILNPTVIRAFAEFRKVANALVRKFGSFDRVHIELAREVNTKETRDELEKIAEDNKKTNDRAASWITENFPSVPIKKKNILKARLFEQQDGRCAYALKPISLERLFDEGYCEIDHILPRSRSGDDSFANKVLCLTAANRDKKNQTPFEWLGEDVSRWQEFEQYYTSPTIRARLGRGKVDRLLKKNFDENSEQAFLSRNLNDTRYMARAIKSYCEEHWQLAKEDNKRRIQVRSGKLTSELRHRWGLENKNRDTHIHHAEDAILLAFSTQSMVQKLHGYFRQKELGAKEPELATPPLPNFRQAVGEATRLHQHETIIAKDGREITLHRLLVSKPPRKKVTGAAHKDGIFSKKYKTKHDGKGNYDKCGNPKEGGGYSLLKSSNPIEGKSGLHESEIMPRVDVFAKEGKFYLVPIYVADFAKEVLPQLAVAANKQPWTPVDDSFDFLFSLFKEDLVAIKRKKEEPIFGYWVGTDSSTAGVSVDLPDGSKELRGIGSKTAEFIKKYQIDPLGYYHEVKNETRLPTIPETRRLKRSKS